MIYTHERIAELAAQAVRTGDTACPLPPELSDEWAAALDRAEKSDVLEGSEVA